VQESTLGVELLQQLTKTDSTGTKLYEFEYELNSTRGRKQILNVVTISDATLYIVNGQHKCGKDACSQEDAAAMKLLRKSANTFLLLNPDA
jgi:PsbP